MLSNIFVHSDTICSEHNWNFIISQRTFHENILCKMQKKIFYEALKELNEREKEILILRYGLSNNDELTQKDVADLLGISQSYISRLEKKIIKKLRSQLNYDEVK